MEKHITYFDKEVSLKKYPKDLSSISFYDGQEEDKRYESFVQLTNEDGRYVCIEQSENESRYDYLNKIDKVIDGLLEYRNYLVYRDPRNNFAREKTKINDFHLELKALLEKYDARIELFQNKFYDFEYRIKVNSESTDIRDEDWIELGDIDYIDKETLQP